MNKLQSFQQFLMSSQSVEIPLSTFFISLIVSALLAYLLGRIYVACGTSLSNRKSFAGNFILLAMTITLIITVVKSSLALSLGLVGALSIVRFRTAIKEPEELAYLFLTIAIGLGLGAGQLLLTICAFGIIAIVIITLHYFKKPYIGSQMQLVVVSRDSNKIECSDIIEILSDKCPNISLKRFDETEQVAEALFEVEFDDHKQLFEAKKALLKLNNKIEISFLHSAGL